MSTPISIQGYKKLEAELEALKKERPEVILAIKEAREEGGEEVSHCGLDRTGRVGSKSRRALFFHTCV